MTIGSDGTPVPAREPDSPSSSGEVTPIGDNRSPTNAFDTIIVAVRDWPTTWRVITLLCVVLVALTVALWWLATTCGPIQAGPITVG